MNLPVAASLLVSTTEELKAQARQQVVFALPAAAAAAFTSYSAPKQDDLGSAGPRENFIFPASMKFIGLGNGTMSNYTRSADLNTKRHLDLEYLEGIEGSAVVGSVVFAFAVSPVIIISNALLLAAVRRFKRLRTPSNYLLCSLAASDLGVGVALPIGIYIRLADAGLCLLVYCTFISLCSTSVVVMAAIAVDRYMSLSQPLRYNDLITHKTIVRYLLCFWLYAFLMGFSPAIYHNTLNKPAIRHCSFPDVVTAPLQLILLCCIYAPCCAVLVSCYAYMYVIARYHARAIYTVEVSVRGARHFAVSRYGRTLAITVGCFVGLWIPFQGCMLLDIVRGSHLVDCWRGVFLSLPIFLASALNPWVYGFRNTEMRAAVHKLVDEMLGKMGVSSSQGCPEITRTNYDGAELNSFVSNMRLCVSTPNRTGSMLLSPRHIPPEKTSLLVVPDTRFEVVVTTSKTFGDDVDNMSPPVSLVVR